MNRKTSKRELARWYYPWLSPVYAAKMINRAVLENARYTDVILALGWRPTLRKYPPTLTKMIRKCVEDFDPLAGPKKP